MSLYQPIVVRKEVDGAHFYYVNEKFVPGVTTILGEAMPTPYALRYWIGEVGNEKAQAKLESAGERGTNLHHACESLLRGETVDLRSKFPSKEDKRCLAGFVAWVNEFNPKFEDVQKDIEFIVVSKEGFAGTVDFTCKLEDEPWIIDIKSSAQVYDSHKLQLGAYQQAYYEMTGIKAKTGILHLNSKVKKGWTFHKDLEIEGKPVEFEDFKKVFEVYKMLNGGKIKEPNLTEVYPDFLNLYKQIEQ